MHRSHAATWIAACVVAWAPIATAGGPEVSCVLHLAIIGHESTVTADVERLRKADTGGQAGSAVKVLPPGASEPSYYNRTNRGVEELFFFYQPRVLSAATWRGKKVLDVGCGGGRFVEQLRKDGVEAYGLDIALTPEQKKAVYAAEKNEGSDGLQLDANRSKGHFIEADAATTGLASKQFDGLFSTFATFAYDLHEPKQHDRLVAQAKEFHRLLKPGGILHLSPMDPKKDEPRLREILENVPGLKIERVARADPRNPNTMFFVEIVRTD